MTFQEQFSWYIEYLEHKNSIKYFFQSLKTGLKTWIRVTELPNYINIYLEKLSFSPQKGFIDPLINKSLKHSLVNIEADFLEKVTKKSKKNEIINFLTQLKILYVLTSKNATQLFDYNLLTYMPINNYIIADKKIYGAFGVQAISPVITLIENHNWEIISNHSKLVSFLNDKKQINSDIFKKFEDMAEKIIELGLYNGNLDDLLAIGKLLLEIGNEANTDLALSYDNISYRLGFIKSHSIVQMLYKFELIYDDCTNATTLNFHSIQTDLGTIKKYNLQNFESLENFSDILRLKENFLTLSNTELNFMIEHKWWRK